MFDIQMRVIDRLQSDLDTEIKISDAKRCAQPTATLEERGTPLGGNSIGSYHTSLVAVFGPFLWRMRLMMNNGGNTWDNIEINGLTGIVPQDRYIFVCGNLGEGPVLR